MTHQQYFGAAAVLFSLVQDGVYIRAVLKGDVKPHLFSWAIWGVMIAVVFAAQWMKGGGPGSWVTFTSVFYCLTITLLAIKYGEKRITKTDWIALIGALSIIPVWCITHDPLWAVILATSIDMLGYYPTFRKSYLRPFEESAFNFFADAVKWGISVFGLEQFSTTTLIYPIFCTITSSVLVGMILWRRAKLKPP